MEKNHTIWGYVAVLDEEKLNKKSFIMLMKRTNKPVSKELLDHIITRERAKEVRKMGVEFIDSRLLNGRYDWVIYFNANDLRTAKAIVELYNELYDGFISEIHLNEVMFSVVSCGIKNPDIKKLEDFFKV